MTFFHTHKSTPGSAFNRKYSSSSKWEKNAETHSQTLCIVKDLGKSSLKWDVSIKWLSSELRKPCRLGGMKTVKDREDSFPSVCLVQTQCDNFCFILFLFVILLLFYRSFFLWETESEWTWMTGQVGKHWEEYR